MKQPYKIMLVDDHQVLLDGLKVLLSVYPNFEVVEEATNAEKALALGKSEDIDLILMDLVLNDGISGAEVTQELKAERPDLKVLACSMYGDAASIQYFIASGADGYIIKNADAEELTSAMQQVLEGRFYIHKDLLPTFKEHKKTTMQITRSEREILRLIAAGLTTTEIAKKIFRSEETVRSHRKNMLAKFGCRNVAALVRFGMQRGWC